MSVESVHDAVIYSAFCIERMFKGVLWEIDPRMVLEDSKEENAFAVLHREKLIPTIAANIDKSLKNEKANHNTITFKEAMLKAKNFSQVTHDHIALLSQLSDFRGILAHRVLSLLDMEAARRFTLRYFQPIVSQFVYEHNLNPTDFFDKHEQRLAEFSKAIEEEEKLTAKMYALIEAHIKEWEIKQKDNAHVEKAKKRTDKRLKDERHGDYWHRLTACPACGNDALLRLEAEWDVEGSSGEGWITGVYAAGLNCEFCGLNLDDHEQIDYFKLNELLSDE
jgi:hypothetical protein